MRTITLKRNVRAFTSTPHNSLSHFDLKIFKAREEITVEEIGEKIYDHKDQKVLRIVGEDPDRFIIENEL